MTLGGIRVPRLDRVSVCKECGFEPPHAKWCTTGKGTVRCGPQYTVEQLEDGSHLATHRLTGKRLRLVPGAGAWVDHQPAPLAEWARIPGEIVAPPPSWPNAAGKRWAKTEAGWMEVAVDYVPQWTRPRACFLRATDDERWANYYAIALRELDMEFPT